MVHIGKTCTPWNGRHGESGHEIEFALPLNGSKGSHGSEGAINISIGYDSDYLDTLGESQNIELFYHEFRR